jgi:hypothetical protein
MSCFERCGEVCLSFPASSACLVTLVREKAQGKAQKKRTAQKGKARETPSGCRWQKPPQPCLPWMTTKTAELFGVEGCLWRTKLRRESSGGGKHSDLLGLLSFQVTDKAPHLGSGLGRGKSRRLDFSVTTKPAELSGVDGTCEEGNLTGESSQESSREGEHSQSHSVTTKPAELSRVDGARKSHGTKLREKAHRDTRRTNAKAKPLI